MAELIRPQIVVNEFDKSQFITEGPTTLTGVVGESIKGPSNEIINITSYSNYTDTFGKDSGYLDFASRFFFKYGGNKLKVVRVTDEYRFGGLSMGTYSIFGVNDDTLASSDTDIPIISLSMGEDIDKWPDSGLVRLEYKGNYEYIIYRDIDIVSASNITLKGCKRGINGTSAVTILTWGISVTPNAGTDFFTSASAHGYRNGDRVQFTGTGGGVAAATNYWIINRTSTTFQITATEGGTVPFNLINSTVNIVEKQPVPTKYVRLICPVTRGTVLSGEGTITVLVEDIKYGKFSVENVEFGDNSLRGISSITTQSETLGTATLVLSSNAPAAIDGETITLIPDPFYGGFGDYTYSKYQEYDAWNQASYDEDGNITDPAGVVDPQEDELFMNIYAKTCGEWANDELILSVYNNKTWVGAPIPYYKNKVDYAPSSDDELLFIIESAVTGAIEETFLVSLDPTAVDYWGKTKFITDVINDQSIFIRVYVNPNYISQDVILPSYAERFYPAGGNNGSGAPVREYKILAAYDLFANKNDVEIDLISAGGNQSLAVQQNIISIAETRRDCVGILNIPLGLNVTDAIRYKRLLSASTYGAIYYNGTKVLDSFTGAKIILPPAIQMTPLIVKTDLLRDPWWATAGINRGKLNEVIELEYELTDGDQDLVYLEGINPLITDESGPYCLGIKTLYTGSSTFQKLPIRRLMLKMEKDIKKSSKVFMHEPNTFDTRLRIVRTIEPYLDSIKTRDGIEEFQVICDSSNNTNLTAAQGKIICDIYVKPIFTTEYIIFNFTVTKDSVSSVINTI